GVRETLAHFGLQLVAQLSDPLRDRVAVSAAVDGGVSGLLDRFRHVKVRLADAQVYRGLQTPGQLEHLTDARDLDRLPSVCNPAIVHLGIVRWTGCRRVD